MSQTTITKANQYLQDGKVRVVSADANQSRAVFKVQGSSSSPYTVCADRGGWICDCPAHIEDCAHVLACKQVFNIAVERHISLGKSDSDLADFFAQFSH